MTKSVKRKTLILSSIVLAGVAFTGLLLSAVFLQRGEYCPPEPLANDHHVESTSAENCKSYDREGTSMSEKLTETAFILLIGGLFTVGGFCTAKDEL